MSVIKYDKNMEICTSGKELVWYNAKDFTIEGKGWNNTESFYERFPSKAKNIVREPVWELSKCSAGISIHFTSNTTYLSVKWNGCDSMDHMTALGVSGVDLYVKHNNKWKWLAVGRPTKKNNEALLFNDISEECREYMLYLPLYNSISEIQLGIPHNYSIKPSAPRCEKPIVFYGTSITQGGCASRPGMCYSAILGRWLDNPTINLGFSGNGIMESEVIDLLCELKPKMYILDCMPNMEEFHIIQNLELAVRKLRKAHKNIPIILIEHMLYCDAFLKSSRMNRYLSSNLAQYKIYSKLINEGFNYLYYIKDHGLIGHDGEATVDGAHFTDLGYMRFSESIVNSIKNII